MNDHGFDRRQKAAAEVKAAADRWIQGDFVAWVAGEPEGAPLSFAHLGHTVRAIEAMAQTVANETLDAVCDSTLEQMRAGLHHMAEQFGQMKGMSKHDGNAADRRNDLCARVWGAYDKLWMASAAVRAQSTLLERGALQGRFEAASKQFEDLLSDMVTSKDRLRQILSERGVDRHAEWFHEDAGRYRRASAFWMIGGALSLLLLGFSAAALFILPMEDIRALAHRYVFEQAQSAPSPAATTLAPPAEHAVALVLGKLAILSTLGIAAAVCFRNHAANKHNQVVNIHRASALQTFRGLIGAITDPRHQELVLVKAAESIYNAQPTGFSKQDGADGPQIVLPMAPYLAGMARAGDNK